MSVPRTQTIKDPYFQFWRWKTTVLLQNCYHCNPGCKRTCLLNSVVTLAFSMWCSNHISGICYTERSKIETVRTYLLCKLSVNVYVCYFCVYKIHVCLWVWVGVSVCMGGCVCVCVGICMSIFRDIVLI